MYTWLPWQQVAVDAVTINYHSNEILRIRKDLCHKSLRAEHTIAKSCTCYTDDAHHAAACSISLTDDLAIDQLMRSKGRASPLRLLLTCGERF
jgi:hypothetical protein